MTVAHELRHSITRDRIVSAARAWIGTPYHHQASCRGAGTDCLGLVRGVWKDVYGHDPAAGATGYSRDWAEVTGREPILEAAALYMTGSEDCEPLSGRLIVFRFRPGSPAKHMAIASDTGRMIHAMEGHAVAEVPIVPWWRRRIARVFEFPGVSG